MRVLFKFLILFEYFFFDMVLVISVKLVFDSLNKCVVLVDFLENCLRMLVIEVM